MEIFEKFKIGLSKSSKNFSEGFKNLVINKKIDSKTLEELEDFLIESINICSRVGVCISNNSTWTD